MNIVALDAYQLNPGDLSWKAISSLGNFIKYDSSTEAQVVERSLQADIIITNKVIIDRSILAQLPNLRCICVSATGYNVIDIEAATERKIPVCNVGGYGANSVAQHVFASILAITNKIESYADENREGAWTRKGTWSYSNETIENLAGMTLGIVGLGTIGKKVAEIGSAFGMRVIAHHKYPTGNIAILNVSLEQLLKESDVVTLHVPLNESTEGLINVDSLSLMKKSSILINTGRGPLIVENDLYDALQMFTIRAAALDVMSVEPPNIDNPLLKLGNCYITPHIAWAGKQARQNLMNELVKNVAAFINGSIRNRVN